MRCIFIYNPHSGKGKVLYYLKYIENNLHKVYDEVVLYESKSALDIKNKVFQASKEYDAIIFSGGDGTFNDVACGLAACEVRPTLGYIPMGTGNDIARNLRIPRNAKGAMKVILAQKKILHDVGKINDQYFMYVVALGAGSSTSYTTNQDAKKILGRLAYARDGINDFLSPNVNKVRIIEKDKIIETTVPLILILNTISIGGMPFNRYGHLNDGLFDVVLVNNGPGSGRFNIIKLFINGMLGFKKKPAVTLKSGKFAVEVDKDAIWCCDGERGPQGNIVIENLHNHLKIFAPKRKAKRQKPRYGDNENGKK